MNIRVQDNRLDELLAQIKEIAAGEYERGVQDALAKVLTAAQSRSVTDPAATSRTLNRPKRLPRGAARQFVERVLSKGPRSIKEIREDAQSETEKLVSYQTARLELERGKKAKRYRYSDGRWSITK